MNNQFNWQTVMYSPEIYDEKYILPRSSPRYIDTMLFFSLHDVMVITVPSILCVSLIAQCLLRINGSCIYLFSTLYYASTGMVLYIFILKHCTCYMYKMIFQ